LSAPHACFYRAAWNADRSSDENPVGLSNVTEEKLVQIFIPWERS